MSVSPVAAASPPVDGSGTPMLTFAQAINVWLMHWGGHKQHEIAVKLGTNTLRIDAVLNERNHEGSRQRALNLRG